MSSVPRWQFWSEIFMISVHVKSALSRSWAIHTGQTEAASLRQRTYHKTAHYCLNSGSEPSANDNESLRAIAQLHAEPCGPTEMQILRRHQCWKNDLKRWTGRAGIKVHLRQQDTIFYTALPLTFKHQEICSVVKFKDLQTPHSCSSSIDQWTCLTVECTSG